MRKDNLIRTIYWQHPKHPIQIVKYSNTDSLISITAAEQELERMIIQESDGNSMTWGYFPEMKPDKYKYPATLALAEAIQPILKRDEKLQDIDLQLAFVRLATSEPRSKYGGMHIDVSAGIDHIWPADRDISQEILRLLLNLSDHSRVLEYCSLSARELEEEGITISRDYYEILSLPTGLVETIEIPPMEQDAMYCLQFISTMIPHAGKTTNSGHFLISYGAYIDRSIIPKFFTADKISP